MDFGIHFDNFGCLRAPFPRLLVSMGINVELGQGGLDIAFFLDVHKAILEVLSKGQLLVAVSLVWCLSDSSAAC